MNPVDEAFFARAQGSAAPPSAQLPPQVRAFIELLVVVAAVKQQQLRAQGSAKGPAVSPRPLTSGPPTLDPIPTQRGIAVQKIAAAYGRAADAGIVTSALDPILSPLKGAVGAGIAAAATGGLAAGGDAAVASLSTTLAAAPAAVPLAAAGVIGSIVIPAITSGQFFGGSIDPYFDATTAAAMKRAAAAAVLIKQDLADTGVKFARAGARSFDLGG